MNDSDSMHDPDNGTDRRRETGPGPGATPELTAELFEILSDTESNDDRLDADVDRLRATHGPAVYAELIRLLCHLRFDEREAERHWNAILEHRTSLGDRSGSETDLRVALVSYFLNVKRRYRNPTILELQMFEQTRASAYRDELTGLHNFRFFREQLDRELQRSERNLAPLSLVMADVDDFKATNDAYGHAAANEVLSLCAGLFAKSVRSTDVVARYGGEEFAVILPETMKIRAGEVAERLRRSIEGFRFPRPDDRAGLEVTVSLGVATYPADAQTPVNLVEAADEAMYRAKRGGKNRVHLRGEDPRSFIRTETALAGTLTVMGGGSLPFRTVDLSEGGARLLTEVDVDPGSSVELRLAIPTTDDEVAMLGRVVQATSDEQGRTQLAVHTVHMDRDDRERLARFLREHPARRTPVG